MKKLIILVTVLLCVSTLNSCDRKTPGNERPQDDYAVGDIVDGFTVVAAGDDGYLLREGLSEDGLPMWKLDFDINDERQRSTTSVQGNIGRFIAFIPDYYVYIHDDYDGNPDILKITAVNKYEDDEFDSNGHYIFPYLDIPQDVHGKIKLPQKFPKS